MYSDQCVLCLIRVPTECRRDAQWPISMLSCDVLDISTVLVCDWSQTYSIPMPLRHINDQNWERALNTNILSHITANDRL